MSTDELELEVDAVAQDEASPVSQRDFLPGHLDVRAFLIGHQVRDRS